MPRIFQGVFAALCFAAASTVPALAQESYPSRPIRIVVPYPGGGAADITTRLVAQKMSERLGQPIIVDDRPGGDSILGTRLVKEAPADGYTILSQSNSFSSLQFLKKDPGFDANSEVSSRTRPCTISWRVRARRR